MENKEYRICENAKECNIIDGFILYGHPLPRSCYHRTIHIKADGCTYFCQKKYRCVEVILKDNNIQKVVKK